MKSILIFGAGKIGTLVACLLAKSGNYHVTLVDRSMQETHFLQKRAKLPDIDTREVDIDNQNEIKKILSSKSFTAIVSCLPFFKNPVAAQYAEQFHLSYFDLTEDVAVTKLVKSLSHDADKAFVSQCGLAPGFISIVANHLMSHFTEIETVKLRVGALPVNSNNALQYALTWSTDGLINEYANACEAIIQNELTRVPSLEGLETIKIDGLTYEAFNTSGGLGSLAETYHGRVRAMTYKTIRYPGHCEKMKFLMKELKLIDDRETLKRILENAIPKTYQDVVLVYVSITGQQNKTFIEENFVKKIYPKTIFDLPWSAIQVTTAASACAVMDIVLSNPERYNRLVRQEDISLDAFLANPFGHYYA